MNEHSCAITLKLRWWVRPAVVLVAILSPIFDADEQWLSRAIAKHGFKVVG